eukprot:TRINITY_DN7286_c0_g1_i2.p1 TRINITY_DN7286_c0_g1~~TRINITY_DN7286_c0_g1_i2.p1  ORF type:complete len:373 (-),score=76.68 TRINITY_DN7286_c0_g1_i2:61-1179(-)
MASAELQGDDRRQMVLKQRKRLRDLYDQFEKGRLPPADLRRALDNLGCLTAAVDRLITRIVADGTSNYKAFLQALTDVQQPYDNSTAAGVTSDVVRRPQPMDVPLDPDSKPRAMAGRTSARRPDSDVLSWKNAPYSPTRVLSPSAAASPVDKRATVYEAIRSFCAGQIVPARMLAILTDARVNITLELQRVIKQFESTGAISFRQITGMISFLDDEEPVTSPKQPSSPGGSDAFGKLSLVDSPTRRTHRQDSVAALKGNYGDIIGWQQDMTTVDAVYDDLLAKRSGRAEVNTDFARYGQRGTYADPAMEYDLPARASAKNIESADELLAWARVAQEQRDADSRPRTGRRVYTQKNSTTLDDEQPPRTQRSYR